MAAYLLKDCQTAGPLCVCTAGTRAVALIAVHISHRAQQMLRLTVTMEDSITIN